MYIYYYYNNGEPTTLAFRSLDKAVDGVISAIEEQLKAIDMPKKKKSKKPSTQTYAEAFAEDLLQYKLPSYSSFLLESADSKEVLNIKNAINIAKENKTIENVNDIIKLFENYTTKTLGFTSPLHTLQKIGIVK